MRETKPTEHDPLRGDVNPHPRFGALYNASTGARYWLPYIACAGCFGVIVLIGFFDMAMTAQGLVLTNLVVAHALSLDREMLALLFSAVIFGAIFVSGLALTMVRWRYAQTALKLAMLMVIVGYVAGEATDGFFHAVLLTNQSRGTGLDQALFMKARLILERALDADRQISTIYHSQVAAYTKLSAEAAQGEDETRDAKCGPICKANIVRARELRADFSDLAEPIAPPDDQGAGALSAPEEYARAKRVLGRLEPKVRRYTEFCEFLGRSCPNPAAVILRDLENSNATRAYGGDAILDRPALVMRSVYASMKAAFSGSADVDVVVTFWLAFVILPVLKLTLLCAARSFLWQAREGATATLEERIRDGDRLIELDGKLGAQRAFLRATAAGLS